MIIKESQNHFLKVFLAFPDFIWTLLWQYIILYSMSTKLNTFQVQSLSSTETTGAVYQTKWSRDL